MCDQIVIELRAHSVHAETRLFRPGIRDRRTRRPFRPGVDNSVRSLGALCLRPRQAPTVPTPPAQHIGTVSQGGSNSGLLVSESR